ncbi:hypothetical protein CO038_00505 [Candidatus Pacearchaeota archaeon CG_4_9_14_0_2_um_filter_39_13]|nr:hypothetical protein [Candidatus Pacearchaeota archaeon]OIO42969.1 MAG: hypothetical protein AUJ64_03290 [Candidatus Pacearchaeota archaeon CG1_02_39_14]PJC45037.1 MAG: hypothetical protein CO038_00505 [Candidatus Pacearchaeota archaeon CG_4_9_14_0_2_um_filter_39_13]
MVKQARGGLVQRVAAMGGLVATLSFSSGCPNSSIGPIDYDRLTSAVGGMVAGYKSQTTTGKKSAAYGELSGMLIRESQMHGNVRAAREGRDQVIVNNGNPRITEEREVVYNLKEPYVIDGRTGEIRPANAPRTEQKKTINGLFNSKDFGSVVMGTCNYMGDFDNDGMLDYPEEFLSDNEPGMKDVFKMNEKITLQYGASRQIPNIGLKLFDSEGRVVDEFTSDESLWAVQRIYNFGEDSDAHLHSGKYRTVWYSGEKFIGSWTFEVKNE